MKVFETYVAIPAIVIIVYLIAEAVKLINGGALSKYIPVICGFCGAIIAVAIFYIAPTFCNAQNVFEALAIGIVSGFSATGINQVIKQVTKDE